MPTEADLRLGSEDGPYGRAYWGERARALGEPDLAERGRRDVLDRLPIWFRTALGFRPPPASVLEIGCGHGALAHLLTRAGYRVTALDASPAAVEVARRDFGVAVRLGTLADHEVREGSIDVAIALDVLEHVPRPEDFLRRVVRTLAPEGIVILQTPRRPDGVGLETLVAIHDPFPRLLLPEHLHLFSRRALERLLRRVGLTDLSFGPAPFSYDMLVVAGRSSLHRVDDERLVEGLASAAEAPLLRAFLDLATTLAQRTSDLGAAREEAVAHGLRLGELRPHLEEATAEVVAQRTRAERAEAEVERLRGRLRELEHLVGGLRASGIYRALVRLGRWGDHDRRLSTALGAAEVEASPVETREWDVAPTPAPPPSGPIAIDLTGVLPGAVNGGARLTALALVEDLHRSLADEEFLLLLSERSDDDLERLVGPRIRTRRIGLEPLAFTELVDREPVSLLVAPISSPPWTDPRVPLVVVAHDLQHRTFPEFFDASERAARDVALGRAANAAHRIVAVSETARARWIEETGRPASDVVAILHGVRDRLPTPSRGEVERTCLELGLERDRYFLYPANPWPHKNHETLLVAFAELRALAPGKRFRLALTGDGALPPEVLDTVRRTGTVEDVVWLGYLAQDRFAALLHGCRALVFPSLYEGFGMPVVEAMAAGRPVVCSNTTALPEIAGDAALLVDPRNPSSIAEALVRLAEDDDLVRELADRGRRRVGDLPLRSETAARYVELLLEVRENAGVRSTLVGHWPDCWTGASLVAGHPGGARRSEILVENPRPVEVRIRSGEHEARVGGGGSLRLRWSTKGPPGTVRFSIGPTFRPEGDPRELGLRVVGFREVADVDDG